jgi:hypothetical protein
LPYNTDVVNRGISETRKIKRKTIFLQHSFT